jgi:two-component system, sensor histidine kinase
LEPFERRIEEPADSERTGRQDGALVHELRHYSDLFEFAPIAYVVTDRNGLIIDANHWVGELLGLPVERLVGKPLVTYVVEADRRRFRRLLLRLGKAPGVHEFELVLDSRNGTPFDAELTVATGDAGVTDDLLRFTIRDIRARKAAEVELRALTEELEQRVADRAAEADHQRVLFADVLDQIPHALMMAEAPSGRMVMVNAAARRLYFFETTTAVESVDDYGTGRRLDGSEVRPRDWPLARAVLSGETVAPEIIEFEQQDGSRILFEVSASPIRAPNGEVVAGVALVQDVSERKRTENAEREFVANAAHELQTPVAAITSAVEALQSGAKHDPDQRDRFLSHLEREADRLGRLSSALLVLARAERGEVPRLELLPLEPLLWEAADSTTPLPSVEVTVDCATNVGILTHRDLFLQILGSLGTNAARNTTEGRITFAARLVGNMRVVVEVLDTGTGIPLEHQEHVFRRFYRTDYDSPGSGLGLAIASQAAGALGGRLELASTPGEGTTLTLNLPGARIVS